MVTNMDIVRELHLQDRKVKTDQQVNLDLTDLIARDVRFPPLAWSREAVPGPGEPREPTWYTCRGKKTKTENAEKEVEI